LNELWEVVGPTWRLPVFVRWHDSLGLLEPDCCVLLGCQFKARWEVLKPFVFERGAQQWICRADLQKVAHKSDKSSSEDVVEWLPRRPPIDVPKLPDNEFIQAYCASEFAIGRDPAVMDAIWISFCKFGLHWLVNEEKEINFLFARVVPIFLRKNWSNATAKWERDLFQMKDMLRGDYLAPDIESIFKRGAADFLASGRVTSWCPEHHLARPILEIIESKEYREAAMNRERARKRRWGIHYWTTFIERLKLQLPAVVEIYAHHLTEATYPICKIFSNAVESRAGKRYRTAFLAQAAEASKHWMESDPVPVPLEQTGEPGTLPGADEGMSEVPDLQSHTRDVRDTGPAVVEPSDGQV
jgi:hypothetical protein